MYGTRDDDCPSTPFVILVTLKMLPVKAERGEIGINNVSSFWLDGDYVFVISN